MRLKKKIEMLRYRYLCLHIKVSTFVLDIESYINSGSFAKEAESGVEATCPDDMAHPLKELNINIARQCRESHPQTIFPGIYIYESIGNSKE